MRNQLSFSIILLLLLSACKGGRTSSLQVDGDTIVFKYATQLTVVRYDGYMVASLKNPWKEGKVLHQYVLVPADSTVPEALPEGTVLRTPLRRSVVFTTVHCSLLSMLHREQSVAGVADRK